MSVTVNLSLEIDSLLRRRAAEDGMTLETYLSRLAERAAKQMSNGDEESEFEEDHPWCGILVLPRLRNAIPMQVSLAWSNTASVLPTSVSPNGCRAARTVSDRTMILFAELLALMAMGAE